jgi:hypothetical protein
MFLRRNQQKTKYTSRLSAAPLAAAAVSSPQFPANILRDNARSRQSTLKNPSRNNNTLRVHVE